MKYDKILEKIEPNQKEKEETKKISKELIEHLDELFKKENIKGKANLVGSVAKETYLSGKSDIDIFLTFPLNTDPETLKHKGLEIAYKCIEDFNGESEEHYASHPYLTGNIKQYKIDFVPCYKIKNAEELKSAVDRTILHTKYIKKHLKEEEKKEVLLLKKFMDEIKVYGSEFKTGGFAGYLCELLIIKYHSFENTLKNASKWKNKTIIDLEKYKTSKQFKDPLIVIDPTDKNRNVGAALKLEKMVEFIIASRNYLQASDSEKIKYFQSLKKEKKEKNEIIEKFKERKTKPYLLRFKIPEIPQDSLHPQLNKTKESIVEKLEKQEFRVYKSDYWSDEENYGYILLELNVYKQNTYHIQKGPKIWSKIACQNFKKAHENEQIYIKEDMLVYDKKREYTTSKKYLENLLNPNNKHKVKVGKNLKENMENTLELYLINEFIELEEFENYKYREEFLNFIDDFLNPNQYIIRQ